MVAAAGNLEHDELLRAGREAHGHGPEAVAFVDAEGARRRATSPSPSGETLVHKRKTEQAHICLGANGYSRSNPDRFAFGVVNTALGGGMSSRLFQEVREKRALAYAVGSYHSSFAETGHVLRVRGHHAVPGRRDADRDARRRSRTSPRRACCPTSWSGRRAT